VNNESVLVTTVENKTNKYAVREYTNAKKVCDLQNIIGRPSTQDLIKYVENNKTELPRDKARHPEGRRHIQA
jgi:hypothetical protein